MRKAIHRDARRHVTESRGAQCRTKSFIGSTLVPRLHQGIFVSHLDQAVQHAMMDISGLTATRHDGRPILVHEGRTGRTGPKVRLHGCISAAHRIRLAGLVRCLRALR